MHLVNIIIILSNLVLLLYHHHCYNHQHIMDVVYHVKQYNT